MAETLDEGLAFFTGLNVISKRTTLTDYSILVDSTFAGSYPLLSYRSGTLSAALQGEAGSESVPLVGVSHTVSGS